MKKTLLWLDDSRNPWMNDWLNFSPIGKMDIDVVWVMSYQEFVDYIMINGLPDAICFDHDLGYQIDPNSPALEYYNGEISAYSLSLWNDDAKTGYDCAKFLCEYCFTHKLPLPLYSSQSANAVGRENIVSYLENYKKHCELPKPYDG